MGMVLRRHPLRIIKAAGRDIDFVRKIFMLKGQLRATPRTKTPRALRGRLKPGRLAAHEPKLRSRHAEPRDARSPGDSPAYRTNGNSSHQRAWPVSHNESNLKSIDPLASHQPP